MLAVVSSMGYYQPALQAALTCTGTFFSTTGKKARDQVEYMHSTTPAKGRGSTFACQKCMYINRFILHINAASSKAINIHVENSKAAMERQEHPLTARRSHSLAWTRTHPAEL
eukprot:scpid39991/ scgid19212/ 